MFDMRSRSTRPLSCTRLFRKDATNVGERLGQSENFSWEKGTRFSDTLLRKKRRQSESNRPLSDLSTDLLVMSHNQPGKRATCPFILFIDNASHICYAVRMANFNFLAQPIIIIILYSRQDKSPNSTWCQSLSGTVVKMWTLREGVLYGLRAGCEWYVNNMWRVVGIPRTGMFLLGQSRKVCFI